MSAQQSGPLVLRPETKSLTPSSHRQRLQPIAEADHRERPPGGRVGFTHEQHATWLQRVGNAREQLLLIVGRQHVQHVEQQDGIARWERLDAGVGRDDGGAPFERQACHCGNTRPKLDADR